MVLDLIVTDTGDGFSASVPSVKECETWAHEEEEAIGKAVEMLRFYLNIPADEEIKIDKARKQENKTVYKLVFRK
jgi:predicted RNase H-like HicB family nuclease